MVRKIAMHPAPPGWPRISTALYYEDPGEAIAWLCRAFGFEIRIVVEDEAGQVRHSELTFGGGVIMVAAGTPASPNRRAPSRSGGINTQNLMVYVDDVDAHAQRAREAGAKIVDEPTTHDHGEEYWTDRSYECEDPGGHRWWFCQRLRTAVPAE